MPAGLPPHFSRKKKTDDLDKLARPVAPIDIELLARLPTLPLRARYMVESFLTGRHRSPIKGTAPEFAEYRAYQPGDDLRRIDWRLYGRSDRLQVKQFEDENQLRVCLALDLSASLRYASRPGLLSKFDYARTVLAAVALLARRQHDAIGLALLGEGDPADAGLLDFLRPGSSVIHHHNVFNRLDTPPTVHSSTIPPALQRLTSLLPGGGLVILASDFYTDIPDLGRALGLFRSERLEFIGLQVLDPMEIEFGDATAGRFVDLEDGSRMPLNAHAVRDGYLKRFTAYRRELVECCREHSADLVLLRTDANPLDALTAYLARRNARA
jgi:uncharacterized protein (DUF58 family)